jgi:hypothetical protein
MGLEWGDALGRVVIGEGDDAVSYGCSQLRPGKTIMYVEAPDGIYVARIDAIEAVAEGEPHGEIKLHVPGSGDVVLEGRLDLAGRGEERMQYGIFVDGPMKLTPLGDYEDLRQRLKEHRRMQALFAAMPSFIAEEEKTTEVQSD